jgi:hypothetical protein
MSKFFDDKRPYLEGRAAQSAYDAVLYSLRTHGEAALSHNRHRLSQFSVKQLQDLVASLKRLNARKQLLVRLAELLP